MELEDRPLSVARMSGLDLVVMPFRGLFEDFDVVDEKALSMKSITKSSRRRRTWLKVRL